MSPSTGCCSEAKGRTGDQREKISPQLGLQASVTNIEQTPRVNIPLTPFETRLPGVALSRRPLSGWRGGAPEDHVQQHAAAKGAMLTSAPRHPVPMARL